MSEVGPQRNLDDFAHENGDFTDERPSQFIRKFSKENSQEERDIAARKIWEKRKEIRTQRSDFEQAKSSIDNKGQVISDEHKVFKDNYRKRLKELENLKMLVDQLNSSNFAKIWNHFKIKRLTPQIDLEDQELSQQWHEEYQKNNLAHKQNADEIESLGEPPELKEAVKILEDFYVEQERKWVELPYSKEDIEKYFSEEYLASLSLEDYIVVMKRFPSEMLTHVTHQGLTDHYYGGHTSPKNIGKYRNNFVDILEGGRLIPYLRVLASQLEEEAIIRFLGLPNLKKEEALDRLEFILNWEKGSGGTKDYYDSSALHFASEGIADKIYGSETGNAPFIAFPSLLIASQYYFSGELNRVDATSGGVHGRNDKWVWTQENKGIDINTGIVFIPEDAQVDPKNGSIYELDDDLKPIGVPLQTSDWTSSSFKKASYVVTSKEYWTDYFVNHPDLKPSKIVFYPGEDPTAAYHKWKVANGLLKRSNKYDMGFPEKFVTLGSREKEAPSVEHITGADSFRQMATAIIEEYYSELPEALSIDSIPNQSPKFLKG